MRYNAELRHVHANATCHGPLLIYNILFNSRGSSSYAKAIFRTNYLIYVRQVVLADQNLCHFLLRAGEEDMALLEVPQVETDGESKLGIGLVSSF